MGTFETYNLFDLAANPNELYDLSGELLPEMADAMGFELSETPNADNLRAFIGHIGPAKTLKDNVALVQKRLATTSDAVTIAADWVERSGSLNELNRGFISPENNITQIGFGVAAFNTAVGRWQERRAKTIIELNKEGVKFGKVVIFAGNRAMAATEHQEVEAMTKRDGRLPTESEFASSYIKDMLAANSIDTLVIPVDSSNGDDVIREGLLRTPYLYDWSVLAVGNAPSTIQVAAQFRKAARSIEADDGYRFDSTGNQLYMAGDTIPVARLGESATTHQNPFTALGQIARNALMLHEQAQTLN